MSKNQRYALNKNKFLSPDELSRLESILRNYMQKDRRNCVMLFLALHTGARATEILNLQFDDLDHETKCVFIKGIKSSNDREIPIYDWLYKELAKVIQTRQLEEQNKQSNDTRIFNISYNRLRQVWELYRPTHKKLHSLRHSFAIRLYKKTKDIRLLQVALGHRNITNTMIYADYVYSQRELRQLIL